jgi:hypothetical protein
MPRQEARESVSSEGGEEKEKECEEGLARVSCCRSVEL